MNGKNNSYIFKYTKRKLIDITELSKKGRIYPYFIEFAQLFEKAEKKSLTTDHISIAPYSTVNTEQYSAIRLGPRAKITFDIELPENPIFETAIAVPQSLWKTPGDGVDFVVAINHDCDCGVEIIFKKTLDPMHNKEDRCWHDVELDLSPFSNQRVRILLYTYPSGDEATAWADWTDWADPMIIDKSVGKMVVK